MGINIDRTSGRPHLVRPVSGTVRPVGPKGPPGLNADGTTADEAMVEIDADETSAFRVQADARHTASYALVITPEKYGAAGDGTTDDTAAVLDAFAAATALRSDVIGGNVYEPRATVRLRGKYKLTSLSSTIVASCNIDGAEGTLIVPAAYASAVLLVGHETSGSLLANATATLPQITKTGATTIVSGSIACKVQNLYHSNVVGRRHSYFETSWLFTGLGQGTAYNRIHLGWTDLCKIAYKLIPGSGGWVNSNTFTGGGVTQSTNTLDGSGIRRSGWKHLHVDGSAGVGTVNSNTFDAVSFEGDLSEWYFDIKCAAQNTWTGSTRFEQGTAAVATSLSTDTFTTSSHGLSVGDMVVFFSSSIPGGMSQGAPYWVSSVPSSSTFKVAETKGGTSVSFTSNGTSVTYYTPPRLRFDGTVDTCFANEIKFGYYSYPGPLDIRYVNTPQSNVFAPSLPRLGDLMPGRNRIINGDFRVNQRGYTSGTALASGAFAFDRWKSIASGTTTLTFTAAPQGCRPSITGSVAGQLAQVVECANLEPGPYTLSWKGAANGRIYKVGDTPPAGALSPITVDIDGSSDMVVEFFSAVGGEVGEVQLERGRVATPFERVPIATALLQCKRYFQRIGLPGAATTREPIGVGAAVSTTACHVAYTLPAEMRVLPTLAVTSVATLRINDQNSIVNPTALAISTGGTAKSVRLAFTVASGLTAGDAVFIDTGDSGALVDFSAEL